MRLFIPPLGTIIKLTEDWDFSLYYERRNWDLCASYFDIDDVVSGKNMGLFRIPEGTVLKVERVFIRQGSKDFESITFRTQSSPDKKIGARKRRFWARLKDANKIECEIVQ